MMSKPMRLDPALQRLAEIEGKVQRRSPPKQIEYWADLGRQIADLITPRDINAVLTGAATLTISCHRSESVAVAEVLQDLEEDRSTGGLTATVTSANVVYGLAPDRRSLIRRVVSEDAEKSGKFIDGRFVPTKEP